MISRMALFVGLTACGGAGGVILTEVGSAIAPGAAAALVAPVASPPGTADAKVEENVPAAAVAEEPAATSPSPPAGPACAERCSGMGTTELVTFAMRRAAQTKACYDSALLADRSLRGKLEIRVRLTDRGTVCEARVVASSMPGAVDRCVTGLLGGVDYPAPRGGCLDLTIPLSFEPRDADGGPASP